MPVGYCALRELGCASFVVSWEPLFPRQPQKHVDFSQRKFLQFVKALEALDDFNKVLVISKIAFVKAIEAICRFIVQQHLSNE
jgi:hypothetical protein